MPRTLPDRLLEKGAVERYSMLIARQGLGLAQAGVRLQGLRVARADHGVKLAELQQERANIQVKTYNEWITKRLNEYEQEMLNAYDAAVEFQDDLADLDVQITVANGMITAATASVTALPAVAYAAAAIAATAAASRSRSVKKLTQIQHDTQKASFNASYERRKDEWLLQQSLSQQDVKIGEQSIALANDDVDIAQQEKTIADMQVSHARDVVEFLDNKFNNVALYEYMSTTLEQVYSFFLRYATVAAKVYENQIAFLRQEAPLGIIKNDYWVTPSNDGTGIQGAPADRKGLTGSARLLQDLYQLDQYAFDTKKRKLPLTKTISLASFAPAEFQRFRETGVIGFLTPMEMFDRDFPGHYLRIISRVRTSIIVLIPPIDDIHATLSTAGLSRVVIGPDVFQTVPIRKDPEFVALSTPINATGIVEMDAQQSDMLFPFEGSGVDATWELRMPKAANQFDYRTIADALITIEYTALDSFDYRQQVIQSLNPSLSADRSFSFRNQFADQWYGLHNPEETKEPMKVSFKTVREDFPPNLESLRIQQVLLYFARADGKLFEVPVTQLRLTAQGEAVAVGGGAISIDGVISTRRGNAGSWTAMLGKPPAGEWDLSLPNTEEMKNRFKNEEIVDMLLVITYSGRTPEWPS